jgi:hypothetical protein
MLYLLFRVNTLDLSLHLLDNLLLLLPLLVFHAEGLVLEKRRVKINQRRILFTSTILFFAFSTCFPFGGIFTVAQLGKCLL